MELKRLSGLDVYPNSVTEVEGTTYFLARAPEGKVLGLVGATTGFVGTRHEEALICPLTPANAAALRSRLLWLSPQPLGLHMSAGCGDRLGLATPGHVRAVRQFKGISPILAQQSIRENTRTGRTAQQVVDDAMWGLFQEGWQQPWGADADHLKTTSDLDLCAAAGYTFYTLDPGGYVDNAAHRDTVGVLQKKAVALPWRKLEDSWDTLRARYLGQQFALEGFSLAFDEVTLLRAACKYAGAIAHAVKLYRHLAAVMGNRPFDLEISVDETETPTSIAEHFYIGNELRRLGVVWVSLAPRFVGRFEKGVDYIGDLDTFETELVRHVAVMRYLGGYKISLHSGSDKFSIYPIVARHTDGLVHLKTAGTSYLEALRAIAQVAPDFFREIVGLAFACYERDKATYHVSADLAKVPNPEGLSDDQLVGLLDQFDARQMLHVTYGSALDEWGPRLKEILDEHEENYYTVLETHFVKHLRPFSQ